MALGVVLGTAVGRIPLVTNDRNQFELTGFKKGDLVTMERGEAHLSFPDS